MRANDKANVGFLAHVQRLNVALTRARKCCYIVANLDCLMKSEDLAAMISNGRQRNLVRVVDKQMTLKNEDIEYIRPLVFI